MIKLDEKQFEEIVAHAIDTIPEKYSQHISNLVFTVEDFPNEHQREKLGLRDHDSLYGLYEGIPLTRRGAGYNLVLPDKITIFKHPVEEHSNTIEELMAHVKHTVWHEVGHYYGLDHDRIHELEDKNRSK